MSKKIVGDLNWCCDDDMRVLRHHVASVEFAEQLAKVAVS